MSLTIDTITDLDTLREVARCLQVENDRLHQRLVQLAERIDRMEGRDGASLQPEIEGLRRELERERQKHQAPKSERRQPHRRMRKPEEERKPQTGGGRTEQPQIEIEVQELTLAPEELRCPVCHGLATPLTGQYEESEVITEVRREFKLVRYRRQKYVRPCSCNGSKILTAPGPLKVIPKGRYSLEFAATVAQSKYADQIPLERQANQMKRQGLVVQPNVLWEQLYHLSLHLTPSYEAIYSAAFEEPVLGADETGWPQLEKGRKLWQVRCLTSERLRYFRIVTRKDTDSAIDLLTHPIQGIYRGVLVSDGAPAYDKAQRQSEGAFQLGGCWSHARRHLLEAEPNYPQATEALDILTKLYQVEREAMAVPNGERLAARQRLRTERSAPLLEEFKQWMGRSATRWDGSDLNQAIRYVDNRWQKLTLFLQRPEVPMHNNASEFALRRPVLGRKNYYGSKSLLGTQVAALFYTLLETARKNNIDPRLYLLVAAERAIREPGTATLPWDLPIT